MIATRKPKEGKLTKKTFWKNLKNILQSNASEKVVLENKKKNEIKNKERKEKWK